MTGARKSVEGWPFSFVDTVRYGDLDANRHLNNVTFLQFFESARLAYMAGLMPDHDPADPGEFGLIFAEAHINYRAPAFYDEPIRTWIRPFALRRSSVRMAFRMVSETDGRLLAEGWGTVVGYHYARAQSIPLPEALLARLREAGAADVELDGPTPLHPQPPPRHPDDIPDLEA